MTSDVPTARAWFRRRARWLIAGLVVLLLGVAWRPVLLHLRAVALLRAVSGPNDESTVFVVEPVAIPNLVGGTSPARLYRPRGPMPRRGVVLLHGVHRLGMDDPRLVRFARAFAALGLAVLTPQLAELADYRLEPATGQTIAASTRVLQQLLPGHARVGLVGTSFAGGMALVTAADPAASEGIGWVLAVGAEEDLSRVLRFYATGNAPRPDGTVEQLSPHPYGLMVALAMRPERFFPPDDAFPARHALVLWLSEAPSAAREALAKVSPATRARLEALFDGHPQELAAALVQSLPGFAAVTASVSPHGTLDRISAPVLLLHGAGDTVIPAAETQWLAKGLRPEVLRAVLISDELVHVDVHGQHSIREQWELVHFIAQLIALATE